MAQEQTNLSPETLASLGVTPAAAPAASPAAPKAEAGLSASTLASLGVAPETPAAPSSGAAARATSPDDFVRTYLPLAQRVAAKTGVSPENLLGQWGLETGWGKSIIPGTNNLGNIKDFSGAGVAATDNMNGSRDRYRRFNTLDEFGDHYAGLLSRRYNGAINTGADPQKFFTALKAGGYAEDPNYVSSGSNAARMVADSMRRAGMESKVPAAVSSTPAAAPAPVDQDTSGLIFGAPVAKRTVAEGLKDNALALAGGVVGLVKTGGDLYGLASGDMDNIVSKATGQAQEWLQSQKSQELRNKTADRSAAIDAQDSLVGKAWTAFATTVSDPALAIDTLVSNIPSFVPAAAAGRVASMAMGGRAMLAAMEAGPVSAAARAAIAQSAGTWGVGSAKVAMAIQQGADVASQAYEDSMKKSEAQWRANPEYAQRIGRGESANDVKHALSLDAARAALPAAAVISVGANSLPGGAAVERALVGGAARIVGGKAGVGGVAARTAKAMAGEATGEAIEEGGGQYAANLAKQQFVDPNQDTTEGVGENAGIGAAGGLMMGAAAGPLHRAHAPDAPTPTPVEQAKQALQPVAEAAAAPDSPLSRAAMAGNTDAAIATQLGVQDQAAAAAQAEQDAANAPKVDPMGDDVSQAVQAARAPGLVQKLRAEDSPVDAKTFVGDMATIQSPSASPAVREKSLARVRMALDWAGQQPDATPAAVPAAEAQPQPAPGLPGDEGAGGVPRSAATTPQQRQAGVDRDAELQAQVAGATTEFDRQQARAQAQLNRERNLGATPAPSAPSAINSVAEPQGLQPGEQERLDTAAATAQERERTADDQPRQQMLDRIERAIEARGGAASPQEARALAEGGRGVPYDRIDESLSPELSTDEQLTQATGIEVGRPAGVGGRARETTRYGAEQQVDGTPAEREAARQRAGSGEVEVGQGTRQGPAPAPAQARAAGAPPTVGATITALRTPGAQRTAEQVATVNQARSYLDDADFGLLERMATRPFTMSSEERVAFARLRAADDSIVRSVSRETSDGQNQAAAPATPGQAAINSVASEPATAVARKRKAHLRQLVDTGFNKVERRADGFYLTGKPGDIKLEGIADAALARAAIQEAIRAGAESGNQNPTDGQKAVNNYKLGRVEFDGAKLGIETPIGAERSGTAPDGTKWSVKMIADYGDLTGTKGADPVFKLFPKMHPSV